MVCSDSLGAKSTKKVDCYSECLVFESHGIHQAAVQAYDTIGSTARMMMKSIEIES